MTTIRGIELQPGDVVVYGEHHRRITRIDRNAGWSWPVALDGNGWAMALPHGLISVHRAE